MQALQSQSFLSSDSAAMDQLHDFLHRRRQADEPLDDFDQIEQEVHRLFVAAEREALGRELSRFDRDVPQIEIDGERYDRVLRGETTYNSAVGPVRVERVSSPQWGAGPLSSGAEGRDCGSDGRPDRASRPAVAAGIQRAKLPSSARLGYRTSICYTE